MNGWSSHLGGTSWDDEPAWLYEITWEWERLPGQRHPGDSGRRRRAVHVPVYEAARGDDVHGVGVVPVGPAPAPRGSAAAPEQWRAAPDQRRPQQPSPGWSQPQSAQPPHWAQLSPAPPPVSHRPLSPPSTEAPFGQGRPVSSFERTRPIPQEMRPQFRDAPPPVQDKPPPFYGPAQPTLRDARPRSDRAPTPRRDPPPHDPRTGAARSEPSDSRVDQQSNGGRVDRQPLLGGWVDQRPAAYGSARPVPGDAPPGPRPPRWHTSAVYREPRPYLNDAPTHDFGRSAVPPAPAMPHSPGAPRRTHPLDDPTTEVNLAAPQASWSMEPVTAPPATSPWDAPDADPATTLTGPAATRWEPADEPVTAPPASGIEPVTAPPAMDYDHAWTRADRPDEADDVAAGGAADKAQDEGEHGLGWLLTMSGLAAVTVVPDAEPAVVERPAAPVVEADAPFADVAGPAKPVSGASPVEENWFSPVIDTGPVTGTEPMTETRPTGPDPVSDTEAAPPDTAAEPDGGVPAEPPGGGTQAEAAVGPASAEEAGQPPEDPPGPAPVLVGAAAPTSPAFARQPGHHGDHGPRPLVDPEQVLAAYTWRFSPETLREVVDRPDDLLAVRDRLTDRLEYAERDAVRARLLSLRAVVSRLLGDLDSALVDGRQALVHAEATGELRRTAIVRARLAHVLCWRGEFAEADRLFEEANSVELPNPLRAEMYELAGRSAVDQGRYLEAVNRFEQALELRRDDDDEMVSRIELALDTITARTRRKGWGPYPRTTGEILQRPAEDNVPEDGYAQARPFTNGLARSEEDVTRDMDRLLSETRPVL